VPGVSIKMAKAAAVVRSAVMQRSNNAWLTGLGVAPVDPVRTRRRQNHVRQPGSRGAERLIKTCESFARFAATRLAQNPIARRREVANRAVLLENAH
jgi:hypothetical protein